MEPKPPVAYPPAGHAPIHRKPVTPPPGATQTSQSIKVYLATAEKSLDFLRFSAVPQPRETTAGRFSRHCLYYNVVCCQLATLHRFPAKTDVFATTLFATLQSGLDLLHLSDLFMSFLASAEAHGDASLVAAAQKVWLKLDAAGLKSDLPWVVIYNAKLDRLGIVSARDFIAAIAPYAGKALPAGFAADLAARARQTITAPFAATSAHKVMPHGMAVVATPHASSGPEVNPTAITVLAGLGCAGSLAAVIGTTMSVPETGPIGAAMTLRVIGGMASADGACSVFLLRMTADSSSSSATLPAPVPVSPGELVVDPSGNSSVESPNFSSDPGDGSASSNPGDGPVSSNPGDGPVSSDPGDGPVSSDPGDGPVSSDPGDGPVSSDPGEGPVSSDPGDGPVSSDPGSSSSGSSGDGDGGGDGGGVVVAVATSAVATPVA